MIVTRLDTARLCA